MLTAHRIARAALPPELRTLAVHVYCLQRVRLQGVETVQQLSDALDRGRLHGFSELELRQLRASLPNTHPKGAA